MTHISNTPPELPRLGVGVVSRVQVETRMLDIPMHRDEMVLRVRPGQTLAFPKMVKVVERFAALSEGTEPWFGERAHRPFVRLNLERTTKGGLKTRTGDRTVDIEHLREWIEQDGIYANPTGAPRGHNSGPIAARIFTDETLPDLVRLADAALETFRSIDWFVYPTVAQEQR